MRLCHHRHTDGYFHRCDTVLLLYVMNRTASRIGPWGTSSRIQWLAQLLGGPTSLRVWWFTVKITTASVLTRITLRCQCVLDSTLAAVEMCYFRKTSSRCTWRPHHSLLFHLWFPLNVTSLASTHYGHFRANNKAGKIMWARPVGVFELLAVKKTAASFPPLPLLSGDGCHSFKADCSFLYKRLWLSRVHTYTQQTHSRLSPEGSWSLPISLQDQPRNDCSAISDGAWVDSL